MIDFQPIVESKYNRENWQRLLHDIFGRRAVFWSIAGEVQTSSPFAKQALMLGKITLSDENTISIYEVELADSVDIERNRRGIRDMLLSDWRSRQEAGAFMLCYRKQESVLRFSYVSESWNFAADGTYRKESTDTKRFTYLLGEGHRSRTAIQQFEKLRDSSLTLRDLTKAFSVDAVSDMFFDDYKKQYEDIIQYVTGKRMVKVANKWEEKKMHAPCEEIMQQFAAFPNPEKTIRDYVKKLMGRLVFLQFLQKKGWLGVPVGKNWGEGDSEFIQNLFAQYPDKDHFVDNVLEPLFNDLNTEREGDMATHPIGRSRVRLPYLNGGLFEREAADDAAFPLPTKYMQSLLEFFASYNFTIDENDPDDAEVGVDPEMLGRIFENLLEDNKDKGAFYTPKEIVSYMCRESLITYLQTDIDDETKKEALRQFVLTHDALQLGGVESPTAKQVDEALCNVKICDPAIGSGAFPMGLLKEMFLCRTALEGLDQSKAAEIKKHIIQQNIYGVDIERGAVDIARLRFWLSLIVDEETPQALPNLDFKIMQGNSLLEQYQGLDLSTMTKKKVNANGMYTVFDTMLDAYRLELLNLLTSYYNCTDGKKKKQMKAEIIENVVKQLYETGVTVEDDDPDIAGNNQFFLWHTWFYDVFSQGGFDIVIGNPPYVQTKKGTVPASQFPFSEGKDKGKQNLYKLFVEHSYNLARDNGICCLITQSSLMCDISAQFTRELLLKRTAISHMIEFPKVAPHREGQLFKDALVATCIALFRKCDPCIGHTFKLSAWNDLTTLDKFDFAEMEQSTPLKFYPNGYCFPLIRLSDFSVMKRMYEDALFLQHYIEKSSQGDFNLTNESFCFSGTHSDVKMYRGKHVHRFQQDNYVEEYIQGRYKDEIVRENLSTQFLICQQISGMVDKHRFNFAISRKERCLFGNSVNKIKILSTMDSRSVLAVLNSNIIDWLFRKTSTNNHVNIYELEQLPIPRHIDSGEREITDLVTKIMEVKQENPSADTSALESDIDLHVYHLYGLTYDEVLIVDPETPITREQFE